MQNKPLISVIIPTYNRGRLILDSVNSVLNQTYKNIELIVVDDCSTDDTKKIIESIKDFRIKYVKLEKKSGACVARNRGIEKSTGEFIAFNDSDDLWIPEKICSQLDFLNKNNADIALCKMECRTPENKFIHNFPNIEQDKQISFIELLKYNSASTQTIFGKTECFREIMFDAKMPRLQDWDVVLRLSKKYKIFYQNQTLVQTFFQKDSISTHPEKGVLAMAMLFEKHKDAILSDPAIVESFFRKKASFVCKTGKNPTEEMRIIFKYNQTAGNFIKYSLSALGLYKYLFNIKQKF